MADTVAPRVAAVRPPGRPATAAAAPPRLTVTKPMSRWAWTFLWAAFSIFTLLPIYWMAVVAFRRRVHLMGNYSVLPTSFSLENMKAVLTSDTFTRYLSNSVIVARATPRPRRSPSAPPTRVVLPPRRSQQHLLRLLTNRMAPVAAFLLPVYLLFTRVSAYGDWSLLDTRLGLILLYTVFNVPFAVWMLQGMIDAIPEELDEAAFVDGAGSMRVLWSVLLPILRPGSP